MVFSDDFVNYPFNHSFFVNDKSAAQHPIINPTIQLFFTPGAKSFDELIVFVRNQGKRQAEFLNEILLLFDGIGTYPKQGIPLGFQLPIGIAQVAIFHGTTWSI